MSNIIQKEKGRVTRIENHTVVSDYDEVVEYDLTPSEEPSKRDLIKQHMKDITNVTSEEGTDE